MVGVSISPDAGQKGCGEVYPGDLWASLVTGLPKKVTPEGNRLRGSVLSALGLVDVPDRLTHDQNDAAIAAVAAAALDGVVSGVEAQLVGDALYIDQSGGLREGPMVCLVVTSELLRQRLEAGVTPSARMGSPVIAARSRSKGSAPPLRGSGTWSATDLHTRFVEAANRGQPVVASYSWIYGRLFGSIPTPWSQGHGSQVASIARGTPRSQVHELGLVALDTFVVSTKTREPSLGHWPAVAYQPTAWAQAFRGAQLLHGAAKAPWEV